MQGIVILDLTFDSLAEAIVTRDGFLKLGKLGFGTSCHLDPGLFDEELGTTYSREDKHPVIERVEADQGFYAGEVLGVLAVHEIIDYKQNRWGIILIDREATLS